MQTNTLKTLITEQKQTLPQIRLNSLFSLALKRSFDIIMSVLGLIVLTPIFAMIAILIKRDSPGPVMYRGQRLGKNGKEFKILKFRSMREEPASYAGPRLTGNDDTRITPIGHWLRNTKLNELPQLWNVLKGDMSLVGPRPEDPEIAALWPTQAFNEITSVRPGITSPASIAYRDEEKRLDGSNLLGNYLEKIAPDKLRLDQLYVRHRAFLTDLDAIFWTLIVLLPSIDKQPDTEGLLFGGPFTRFVRPYFTQTLEDFLTSMVAIGVIGLAWRTTTVLQLGWGVSFLIALIFSLQFGLVNTILGLKRVQWSRASAEDAYGLLFSGVLVMGNSILLDLFIPDIHLPDGFLIAASILTVIGFCITRYRLRLITGLAARWVRVRGYGIGERVMVIGAGAGGEVATWLLRRPDFRHLFQVIGYVDDSPFMQGMRFNGISVLGTTADIPTIVRKNDVGMICFAVGGECSDDDRQRILVKCRQSGARLVILSDVIRSLEAQFFSETSRYTQTASVGVDQ